MTTFVYSLLLLQIFVAWKASAQEATSGVEVHATVTTQAIASNELTEESRAPKMKRVFVEQTGPFLSP